MNRLPFVVLLSVLLTILASCSHGSGSPVLPGIDPVISQSVPTHSPHLWGIWDMQWNPDEGTIDAVPNRGAMFTCNVIKFLNLNPPFLTIDITEVEAGSLWADLDIDIGLRHPFPGLDRYTGFDVMGIFMGEGSDVFPGTGLVVAGAHDQLLKNADGYTRRFNAVEYASAGQKILPLQGYVPGYKGTPGYIPKTVLNPYKYYADGLSPEGEAFPFLISNIMNRGCFRPGHENHRVFRIRLPQGENRFQYAVLANWEPNKKDPKPPMNLFDFPITANSEEAVAFSVVDHSNAVYTDPVTFSGNIAMDITPWDWSANCSITMEEYTIRAYSSAWTGPANVDMTATDKAPHRYTFNLNMPAETLTSGGELPVWIEVIYPGYTYASKVGVPNDATGPLTAYFKTSAHVKGYDPEAPTAGYIYVMSDADFMEDVDEPEDNEALFLNLLNMVTLEPYASSNQVMYYQGHTSGKKNFTEFKSFLKSNGYEEVDVAASPYTPLDPSGMRMLIISTMNSVADDFYTVEEIQTIKEYVGGGGICLIFVDKPSYYKKGTDTIQHLITDLDLRFFYTPDFTYNTHPYTDITLDPATLGVTTLHGASSGRLDLLPGGISIARGNDKTHGVYEAILKTPVGK